MNPKTQIEHFTFKSSSIHWNQKYIFMMEQPTLLAVRTITKNIPLPLFFIIHCDYQLMTKSSFYNILV